MLDVLKDYFEQIKKIPDLQKKIGSTYKGEIDKLLDWTYNFSSKHCIENKPEFVFCKLVIQVVALVIGEATGIAFIPSLAIVAGI